MTMPATIDPDDWEAPTYLPFRLTPRTLNALLFACEFTARHAPVTSRAVTEAAWQLSTMCHDVAAMSRRHAARGETGRMDSDPATTLSTAEAAQALGRNTRWVQRNYRELGGRTDRRGRLRFPAELIDAVSGAHQHTK